MQADEFTPLESFSTSLRRLPVVILLALVGGLLGLAVSYLVPPIYEARALMVVNIDFEQTGPLEELEQDQIIFTVESLFFSPPVLEQVNGQLVAQGIQFPPLINEKNASVERRRANLYLAVRNPNPQAVAQAANVWAQTAYQALDEAHLHALRAEALRDYMNAIQSCLPAPESLPGSIDFCEAYTPEEAQAAIDRVTEELDVELQASMGILSAVNYDFSSEAAVPDAPVSGERLYLILGGVLAGFLLGAVIASTRFSLGR